MALTPEELRSAAYFATHKSVDRWLLWEELSAEFEKQHPSFVEAARALSRAERVLSEECARLNDAANGLEDDE